MAPYDIPRERKNVSKLTLDGFCVTVIRNGPDRSGTERWTERNQLETNGTVEERNGFGQKMTGTGAKERLSTRLNGYQTVVLLKNGYWTVKLLKQTVVKRLSYWNKRLSNGLTIETNGYRTVCTVIDRVFNRSITVPSTVWQSFLLWKEQLLNGFERLSTGQKYRLITGQTGW